MAMILSFEFGNNIKIIGASKKGEILSVLRCMTVESSSVKDGKIIDMDGTVNVINEELKNSGIKTKKAIFVINSSKIMIRKIKLPLLKKNSEILSMIKIELQQTISADLNKYKIIYEISGITNENKVTYAEYIVYCVPIVLISDYIELAAKLKLKLLKIDILPNCFNGLYKNNIKINGFGLNNRETAAFISVNKNFISFWTAHNGVCDFYISSELEKNFIEKAAESVSQYGYLDSREYGYLESNKCVYSESNEYGYSESNTESLSYSEGPSFNSSLVVAQIAKFIRYYYSVSGNRSIDKIYIYGSNYQMLKEAIKTKLDLDSEIIENISGLYKQILPDDFELSKYFNNVLALFSRNKETTLNKSRSSKLKNNYGYAAILLVIAAASMDMFGFFNSRAVMRNELTVMSSFINDGKNNEIYSVIEGIKNETDYLKLYLQEAEELMRLAEENDNVEANILREIYRIKPFKTVVTSIYSDKDSTQLMCDSPSMSEAALFFSDLKGLDRVESAHMPAIQAKTGEPFSYSIVFKLKDVSSGEVLKLKEVDNSEN